MSDGSSRQRGGRAFVLAVLVALTHTLCQAQEPAAVGAPEATTQGQPAGSGRALPVTLADCLQRALVNNRSLESSRLSARSSGTQLPVAESAFDPVFTSDGNYRDSESPTASSLEGTGGGAGSSVFVGNLGPGFPNNVVVGGGGAPVPERKTYDFNMSLTKKFLAGTQATATYVFQRLKTNQFFATINPSLTNSMRFTVTQPLLRGGWFTYNLADVRQAENQVRIAREQVRLATDELVSSVQRAYWDLVYALQDLEVKRDSLALAKRLKRDNEEKFKAGTLTMLDVVQAEFEVQNRATEVRVAETDVANQMDSLRQFVDPDGLETRDESWVPVDRPPSALASPLELDRALADAFRYRSDWRQAQLRYDNARTEEDQTRNELLPRLDVDGSVSYNGLDSTFHDSFEDVYKRDFDTWSFGFSLEFPIGNRAARANHLRANLDRRRERSDIEELRSTIHKEVRAAHRQIATTIDTMAQTREAVRLAREQLKGEQARLDVGKSTSYRVLEIQEDLAQARSTDRRAQLDYMIALADLELAKGTLLPYYGLVEDDG